MSRGSKRRKSAITAEGGPASRRVWFIAQSTDTKEQSALRTAAENAAHEQGWNFSMRRSRTERVLGGVEKDRPYQILPPRDAKDIYRDIHTRPCLVIASHACYIKGDPSAEPSSRRNLIPISSFLRYKSIIALVRGVQDVKSAAQAFVGWPDALACGDHHDPRVLPLHVFDSSRQWEDLAKEVGRVNFDRHYGLSAGSRSDPNGHEWRQPNALHGSQGGQQDSLVVAGSVLQIGYHWDVQKGRRGSGRIISESEIWKLERQNAYLNVYPNGYLRGSKDHGARRAWPK